MRKKKTKWNVHKKFSKKVPMRGQKQRFKKEKKTPKIQKTLLATVQKHPKGFAFLVFEDPKVSDLFLPPHRARSLFEGDLVQVTPRKGTRARLDIKCIQRRLQNGYGQYEISAQGEKLFCMHLRKDQVRFPIHIPASFRKNHAFPKIGDWVFARLEFAPRRTHVQVRAVVEKCFGKTLPAVLDVDWIAKEHFWPTTHSEKTKKEAQSWEKRYRMDEFLKSRKDFRKIPWITIDGIDARDFDDAIYVEQKKDQYHLWVAIADVSFFVKENTLLDQEAFLRSTSAYFPERAIHMLPKELSEGFCSLQPNVPRLAFVVHMVFSKSGKRTGIELFESVIQSHRRATYQEIQKEWEIHQKSPKWHYMPYFELFKILKKTRKTRGSIDFDFPEPHVILNELQEPVSIEVEPRLESHRLIEEFMIAANEAVTEWMVEQKLPFIYRIHENPSEEDFRAFQMLCERVGFVLPKPSFPLKPKYYSQIVENLFHHPARFLLNTALLRSMKQAQYSVEHKEHYGLASLAYTHFTSPIRRYPDLVVHRLLKMALLKKNKAAFLKKKEQKALEEKLIHIARHCSIQERKAEEIERQARKIKQVRLMQRYLGSQFEGRIVHMTEQGLFVQVLSPFVEGFVKRESLSEDQFLFKKENFCYLGQRTKKRYRIGDLVRVQVVRAHLENRKIECHLVKKNRIDDYLI